MQWIDALETVAHLWIEVHRPREVHQCLISLAKFSVDLAHQEIHRRLLGRELLELRQLGEGLLIAIQTHQYLVGF